jgi:hypothetical protein
MGGLTLSVALLASAVLAAPARPAFIILPHGLQLLINGKQLPKTPFSGPDRYTPIKASKLQVVARWKGDLRGTGYKVVIRTTEPDKRTYRTCSTGTSCPLRQRVPILKGEEMSWTVTIEQQKPHVTKILSGFMVCLNGTAD